MKQAMGMQIDSLVQLTRKTPLFCDLAEDELNRFLSAGKIQDYASGQRLIEKGQPSRELYILLCGELCVEVAGVSLAEIKPVSPVGEMGVVSGQTRSADVVVVKPSKVLVIERRDFDRIMAKDEALGRKVYRNLVMVLSDRIREMDESAEEELRTLEDRLQEANRRLELAYLQMRDQKDRLSMLLYRGEFGFLVDQDGRIVGVTENALERIGRSRRELVGGPFLDLVDEDSRRDLAISIRQGWAGTSSWISIRMLEPQGGVRPFEARAVRVNMERERKLLILMREAEEDTVYGRD